MKQKGTKRFLLAALLLALCLGTGLSVNAAERWQKKGNVWYCMNGREPVTGWVKSGGKWYYTDSTGRMVTNRLIRTDGYYYLDSNGVMRTGWVLINRYWFYFGGSGKGYTGWVRSGNAWYLIGNGLMLQNRTCRYLGHTYYLGANGVMRTGWQQIQGKWYYFGSDGAMRTGWQYIGGKWYFMNADGVMATGMIGTGTSRYMLSSDGAMVTGWKQVGTNWYYFDQSGRMKTGWLYDGHNWYYMNTRTGAMHKGWLNLGNDTYYMNTKNGTMWTGWLGQRGKYYYFTSSGAAKTGWLQIGSYWYYFYPSNKTMAVNTTIDGCEIDRYGRYKLDSTKRLDNLVTSIVNSQTSNAMTNDAKLRTLFLYVVNNCSYQRKYNFTGANGWWETYAYEMLTTHMGNCYNYGAAFAYLAKKATGYETRVGWGMTPALSGGVTPHGWCEIKINGTWYIFDPDMYKFSSTPSLYYYVTHAQMGSSYINPSYGTIEI